MCIADNCGSLYLLPDPENNSFRMNAKSQKSYIWSFTSFFDVMLLIKVTIFNPYNLTCCWTFDMTVILSLDYINQTHKGYENNEEMHSKSKMKSIFRFELNLLKAL